VPLDPAPDLGGVRRAREDAIAQARPHPCVAVEERGANADALEVGQANGAVAAASLSGVAQLPHEGQPGVKCRWLAIDEGDETGRRMIERRGQIMMLLE
jgi:hypothetical protein